MVVAHIGPIPGIVISRDISSSVFGAPFVHMIQRLDLFIKKNNLFYNGTASRSCFRGHGPTFSLLAPQSAHGSAAAGQDIETKMPEAHPDLKGLFASGGGVKGALAGHEMFDAKGAGLIDGRQTPAVPHLVEAMAMRRYHPWFGQKGWCAARGDEGTFISVFAVWKLLNDNWGSG